MKPILTDVVIDLKNVSLAVVGPLSGPTKRIILGASSYLKEKAALTIRPYTELNFEYKRDIREGQCVAQLIIESEKDDWQEYEDQIATVSLIDGQIRGKQSAIFIDDTLVGKMAAESLLARGFKCVAFVGNKHNPALLQRYQSFNDRLMKSGVIPFLFYYPLDSYGRFDLGDEGRSYYFDKMGEWLENLPKPIGIFTENDWIGFEISIAAKLKNIAIPQDLAIVGVDDDDFVCKIAKPNLASIRIPYERMGYYAALLIVNQLANREVSTELILEPTGLIERDSLKVTVVEDEVVRQAMEYIRENLRKPINVEDVLNHLGVSRSLLERRFREEIGTTPLVELRRQRVERARELLVDSHLSVNEIGERCGFASAIRFTTVFKEQEGVTPTEFRNSMISDGANQEELQC